MDKALIEGKADVERPDDAAIHDQSYRHWEGHLRGRRARWWSITRAGLALTFRRRWMLLFILGPPTIHLLAQCTRLYAFHYLQIKPLGPIRPALFQQFLLGQSFFVVIACIFVGAGLIAHDLRDHVLQFYLSKPITRLDYAIGKVGVLVGFLSLITLVPGLLLFLVELAFGEAGTFFRRYYWLPFAITLYSFLLMVPTALLTLAFSALTTNARIAAIGFAGVGIFSPVLYEILHAIFRTTRLSLISFWANLEQLGHLLFGMPRAYHLHPVWALLVLALWVTGSIWVLARRIRAVEVVE